MSQSEYVFNFLQRLTGSCEQPLGLFHPQAHLQILPLLRLNRGVLFSQVADYRVVELSQLHEKCSHFEVFACELELLRNFLRRRVPSTASISVYSLMRFDSFSWERALNTPVMSYVSFRVLRSLTNLLHVVWRTPS